MINFYLTTNKKEKLDLLDRNYQPIPCYINTSVNQLAVANYHPFRKWIAKVRKLFCFATRPTEKIPIISQHNLYRLKGEYFNDK
jgi:hypothetical protein